MRVVKLLLLLFLVGAVLPRAGPAEVAQDGISYIADLSPPTDLAVLQPSEHGLWSVTGAMLMEKAEAPNPGLTMVVRSDPVTSTVPMARLTPRDPRESLIADYEYRVAPSAVSPHLRL